MEFTPYGTFNTTGVKGSNQVTGQPGLFKNPANPYLKTTDWDWDDRPSRIALWIKRNYKSLQLANYYF